MVVGLSPKRKTLNRFLESIKSLIIILCGRVGVNLYSYLSQNTSLLRNNY